MIELLSKLDPKISPFLADNQDTRPSTEAQIAMRRIAQSMSCQKCRGRKKIKELNEVTDEKEYIVCPRCFGSGRKADGLQTSSASRSAPVNLSQEVIANLVQGMRPERYRAAVVHVTRNQAVMNELIDDMRKYIAKNQAHTWKMSEDLRQVRCLGLARVAVHNLMQPERAKANFGAILMCCTAQTWRKTWATRADEATDRVYGWSSDAGYYMYSRMMESLDEVEAA